MPTNIRVGVCVEDSKSSGHQQSHRNHQIGHDNVAFDRNIFEIKENATRYGTENKGNGSASVMDSREQPPYRGSWWYACCLKCRRKEVQPGWEPIFWPKVCPHPFCPSYRHVARNITLCVIGLLVWSVVYCVAGKEARPGGQIFGIASLCLCAHFVGYIFRVCTLPGLIGMLITGMFFQNVGLISIQGEYTHVVSFLRKVALVVLLTRAGLDLDPEALKKLYFRVITLGLIPWCAEAAFVTVLSYFFLNMPWKWAVLLGCIVAAVAPAVVVPCLFRLRSKGYGVAKGIPTLILAVAGIDDALSVAFFGLFHGVLFSQNDIAYTLLSGPVSLLAGLFFGLLWGLFAKFVPEQGDPFVVPLRVLMLLFGGLMAVFGSKHVGFEGAGPLAVISASFVSVYCWSQQGWHIEDNPVATAFEIFWMLCEPVLFGLTGTQVVFAELDTNRLSLGCAFIVLAFIVRILVTILVASGSSLNLKEKLFISLSWMAKASVQAVLAPAALESARHYGSQSDITNAQILVTICIMSMLITVPIGAISISATGTRLLTKSKNGASTSSWRRNTRPSIRDISLNDEELCSSEKSPTVAEGNKLQTDFAISTPTDEGQIPAFTRID